MENKKINILEIISKLVIFALLGILSGGAYWYGCRLWKIEKNINNTLNQLKSVSDFKKNAINSYISEIKKEVTDLSESEEVKNLLKQPLVVSEIPVKIEIDGKTDVIKEEIKNYIKANPNKTLYELQNDKMFQDIAVQEIGLDGYSILQEYKTRRVLLHKDKKLIGKILADINIDLPEHGIITELSKKYDDASGYYDWREPDGTIRKKYMRLIYLGVKTADGIELFLSTTGYVDNYRIARNAFDEDIINYFREGVYKNDIYNLFLVNPDGYLIFTGKDEEDLGINLNWSSDKYSELSKIYFMGENEKKIIISDAFIGEFGDIYPNILLMTSVHEKGELLGYLVFKVDFQQIFNIVGGTDNLGKTGETYLVEKENKLLISPLRNRQLNIFSQNIDTENINNCFENKNNLHSITIGYDGGKIIGVNTTIPETNWCMATEISETEVMGDLLKNQTAIALVIAIFIFGVGVVIVIKEEKQKENIKKTIGIEYFMSKLKAKFIIPFSIVFGVLNGFSFPFVNWSANNLGKFFISLTMMVLTMLFFYSFKLRNEKYKRLISIGTLLIFFKKEMQIVFEKNYFGEGFVETYLWVPGLILGIIGIYLIFYGFKEEIKDGSN